MTQPIDPQLGVPTTPNLDIPQIPYKKLPFPYQDLTDVPQPDNAQYYPDHIPGVVSAVAGMHPTGTQAQSIHTDGNHAMLTSDVGGKGGPALWAQALPENASRLVLGPLDEDASRFGFRKLFFGLLAAVSIFDFGTISGTANVWTETINFDLNNLINIASLSLGGFYDGNMIHGVYTAHCEVLLPAPIDLSLVPPGLFGESSIHTNNQTNFTVLVYHAPIFENES